MIALNTQRLQSRRLNFPTSGSARRRARERRRAERTRIEGERLARGRREQQLIEKIEQQRKAREELASYEPWGRAGGGAPNQSGYRFNDLRTHGIYPDDEIKSFATYEGCYRRLSTRKLHGHTSLRLREDPQLFFAEQLRHAIDNDIRYKQTPEQQRTYKKILDEMVDKKNKAIRDEIRRNLAYERKMQTMNGPWGKPGPGGTIWRNPRNIGLNFSKSMGWTNNEIFDKLEREHKGHKRSSLTLPLVKKDDDLTEQEQYNIENIKTSNIVKLPDIAKKISSNGSSGHKSKTDGDDILNEFNHCKSKNGKSKKIPRNNKFVKQLCSGERMTKIIMDEQIDNGHETGIIESKATPEGTILRLTGGIELVPLLARRRRIGARTLPSSDVTRPSEQYCQWREMINMDYLKQLKQQMRLKCEQKEESQRASAESVIRHHSTWSSLWGRPGHGAPQQRGRYARNNLTRILYMPPLTNVQYN